MKRIISSLFDCYRENAQIVIKIFGIRFKFKSFTINQLEDVCCIQNVKNFKNVYFPHPIGIVIHPDAIIGEGCTIFQNVTIGQGKLNKESGVDVPTIKDGVTVYANSVIIGGITIGKNSVIGAGSIVLKDVPDNAVVAGNPARVLKIRD